MEEVQCEGNIEKKKEKKERWLLPGVLVQLLEVNVIIADNPGHAGAAIFSWNLDSVHVGLMNSGENGQNLGHLGGGDVLSLPAEGVANAVNEVEVSSLVLADKISGSEVLVSLDEGIGQDLLLGGGLVGVPLKPGGGVAGNDGANQLARLTRGALNAPAVLATDNFLLVNIELHNLDSGDLGGN